MTKISQLSFIFNAKEILVKRKDLRASTLVGEPNPLAVLHLNNQQYISTIFGNGKKKFSLISNVPIFFEDLSFEPFYFEHFRAFKGPPVHLNTEHKSFQHPALVA